MKIWQQKDNNITHMRPEKYKDINNGQQSVTDATWKTITKSLDFKIKEQQNRKRRNILQMRPENDDETVVSIYEYP